MHYNAFSCEHVADRLVYRSSREDLRGVPSMDIRRALAEREGLTMQSSAFNVGMLVGSRAHAYYMSQHDGSRPAVIGLTSMNTGMQKRMSHLSASQLVRKLAGVGITGGSEGLYNANVAPLVS